METKKDYKVILTIAVAALGYFVDIYDLILFSVVRVPSLKDLGLNEAEILDQGLLLLNIQMAGMLLGGVFFGVWADKKGRLKVLLGSILMYSLATFLNAFVQDVTSYAILRFIAGFGLAGELGIGITLVSELLPKEKRSYGTMAIATIGMSGALLAWPIAKHFDWRTAYIIGGVMGISLLLLRVKILESELFKKVEQSPARRGDILSLFTHKERFYKFLACILVAIQLWYIMGILITLSPEFTSSLGISKDIVAGESIFYCYIGVIVGGFLSALVSQVLKSRIKALIIFMILSSSGIIGYFFLKDISSRMFYIFCVYMGIASGYWAIFVQVAAEQFGTNIRATATTAITNFGRATLIPLSMLFVYLKANQGIMMAGLFVGILTIVLSIGPLFYLKESFHKNLDYVD
ncbi:MAG: MFS transporter [Bdellovibrionota bacterium]